MIELRVLGEIQLRADSGAPIEALLRQPKRLALLAYLAAPTPGTWHRRDVLLALFWPELDTTRARTALRNALYVIRQALGDAVLRTRGDEEIAVNPDALRTDLAVVWEALRSGRPGDALARYGGELLPGLIPPESDGFVRWLDTERARLRIAVASAAKARADALQRAGDFTAALTILRRVAEIQPDDETVVRTLMSLHETMGDRAGALAVFENYRARLASDYEAEPATETLAIVRRLRELRPDVGPVTSQAVKSARRPNNARAAAPASGKSNIATNGGPPNAPKTAASIRGSLALSAVAGVVVLASVVAAVEWRASHSSRPLVIGTSTPVTTDEGLQVEAAIAPNGRMVAYAKGTASRLHIFVQKLDGGTPWKLTGDSTAAELLPQWSPDSDELLFLSRSGAYVAPSVGGTPRLVARGTAGDGMVRSAAWWAAGDSIVIVRNDSLIVQALSSRGSRFVGAGRQLHSCVGSPRASWIACVSGNWLAFEPGPLFGNEAPSAIVLFPAGGGPAIDLTGSAFQHKSPAWSADGKFLWMLSNRDGEADEVYAVAIGGDGRVSGPFVRVGLTAESISLSERRIAYSVAIRRANIWSVSIPGDELTTLSKSATRLTSGNQLIELVSGSSDGKWIVYDSNVSGNADIYRMPLAGGAAERLTDDARPEYAGTLSPDGQELAWQRFIRGERHLFVKRLDGDSAREIMPVPGDQGVPHWSPDGRALAAWSHNKEAGAVFVVHRDAAGRWKRPAWRLEGGQLPVWSPDGRSLAFIRYDGGINTIPADSGAGRSIYTPRSGSADPVANQLVWSLDSATVWFIGSDARGRGGIWSVSSRGGAARLRVRFDDPSGRSHGAGLTTDGSRFYFTLDERFSNVWSAELRASSR